MNFIKNLSPKQIIALTAVACVVVIAAVMMCLPFKTTLTSAEIPNGLKINLPCTEANLTGGDETKVVTKVTGKGMAHFEYLQENNELKLRLVGIVKELTCTTNITIAEGSTISLPESMVFIARNGVRPAPSTQGGYREFQR